MVPEHPSGASDAAGNDGGGAAEVGRDPTLTERQRRVADLVATGVSNREIAEVLGISTKTVEYHLANLFSALGVHTRSALTAYWWRTHTVPLAPPPVGIHRGPPPDPRTADHRAAPGDGTS